MNRQEIIAEYTIENGRITNPGKFEYEPIYAPYLYAMSLEGGADDSAYRMGASIDLFILTPHETTEFPELEPFEAVILFEDDHGFVTVDTYAHRDDAYLEMQRLHDEWECSEDGECED